MVSTDNIRNLFREEWLSTGLLSVDLNRAATVERLAALRVGAELPIDLEVFLARLFKLYESVKQCFECEEEIIRSVGMGEVERNGHIDSHTKLLEIFSRVYVDLIKDNMFTASDAWQMISVEMAEHRTTYDRRLHYILNPS